MTLKHLLIAAGVAGILSLGVHAEIPTPAGWYVDSNHAGAYRTSVQHAAAGEPPVAHIESISPASGDFIAIARELDVSRYAGKLVSVTARVQGGHIDDTAALWLTYFSNRDDASTDDIQLKAGKGHSEVSIAANSDWRKPSFIVRLPKGLNKLAFGVSLRGAGEIWATQPEITILDASPSPRDARVPTPVDTLPIAPRPFSFTE